MVSMTDTQNAVVGYTIDGGGAGVVDGETFSADQAIVRFTGKVTHPSVGKGKMVSAIRAASFFVDKLPRLELAPEVTDGRQGFLHPHHLEGTVAAATVKILLRDFDTPKLAIYADQIRQLLSLTEVEFPGLTTSVEIHPQYRNMADGLKHQPLAIDLAVQAYKNLGRPFKVDIIRGGTDGSQFTEKGLPTPNLASGQHNIHSPLEFACLDEMAEAVEHLVVLLDLWQQHGRS